MNNRTITSKITWWVKHHLIFLLSSAATAVWSSPLEPPRRIQNCSGSLEQLPRTQRPTSLHSKRSKDSSEGGEGHRSQAQHHQQSCESTSSRSSAFSIVISISISSSSSSSSMISMELAGHSERSNDRGASGKESLDWQEGEQNFWSSFCAFFYLDSMCGTQFCR